MFFKKKSGKNEEKCYQCSSKVTSEYSFCPYCGCALIDEEKELQEFGMLGRYDVENEEFLRKQRTPQNFGFTDKIIGSLVNNLMKSLDKQFKEMERSESGYPTGIKIKIGVPQARRKVQPTSVMTKPLSAEQLKKMEGLPRTTAKTHVRRLPDRVVYELNAPGILSTKDVIVSKLESGYEVKAIGEKNVYVNSLPVNLPIHGFSIDKDKLFVEFRLADQ